MNRMRIFAKMCVLFVCIFSISSACCGFSIRSPRRTISPLSRVSRLSASSSILRDPVIDPIYEYQRFNYTQHRDHFNFENSDLTFDEQVLWNDSYWQRPNADGSGAGPIFFYAGNEGGIEVFANNSGFMWDLAPQFGALLVFPEHRYYGTSMPIDNDPIKSLSTPEGLQYLTAEQAMADYAELALWLKRNLTAFDAPIILFGGSYGGMLATWMRIKYPAIFAGAVASSAPIWQFTGMYDPKLFNSVLTNDSAAASPLCPRAFNASWGVFDSFSQTQEGRDAIQQIFHVCDPITSPEMVDGLYGYITEAVADLGMVDYPYNSTFLGDIPANPINVMCSYFTQDSLNDGHLLLSQLHKAIGVYYNYSGGYGPCYNLSQADYESTLDDASGWDYQSCTEMVMPISQEGLPNDMFFYAPWNLTADIVGCQQSYPGVTPRPFWTETNLAGKDLSAASNIVFTNGNLDPWGPGGVHQNISATVLAYEVIGGAHHIDLRHATPFDPPGVLWVRSAITQQIQNWINGITPNPNPQCSDNNSFPTPWQAGAIGGVVALVSAFIIWRGYIWYQNADPSKAQTQRDTADRPTQDTHNEQGLVSQVISPQSQLALSGSGRRTAARSAKSVNGNDGDGYERLTQDSERN